MNEQTKTPPSGLAGRLVIEGLIDADDARFAQQSAVDQRIPLVTYLVESANVESSRIAQIASQEFGAPRFDISAFDKEQLPEGLVEPELITKHHALPLFHRGKRLFIAVSDPTNLAALDEIKFHTGISTEPIIVDETSLSRAIAEWIEGQDTLSGGLEDLEAGELDGIDVGEPENPNKEADDAAIDETPIVRFVNKVLLDAIRQGASDIHFEPYEKDYRVRFRTDGMLQEVVRPPRNLAPRLSARLKVMSQMDISERRIPQDGRIQMKLTKNRNIDFRVNTLPTLFGEKIVLRILDPTSAQMGIDALGYEPDQKKMYMRALDQPQGMILVTGPTGSGKTVSLYTGLNILNEPHRNISTAEDPVEINLSGINQVHVNPRVGLGFAEALRSFLRQDPDVIMVGEIRDLETAEIAIKAAQTGHLVLSTLHTNSAAETITRLLNMGVPAFNLATSVSLIIAQRLARRLCKECKVPADHIPHEVLLEQGFTEEMLHGATIMKAVGCDKCSDGFKGRVGVYEVVRITQSIANLVMTNANSMEIARQARQEGFHDLRSAALLKAAQGLITLEEVNRVTID
ncbi:type IV-A pilus assembly ATPase PilB [Chromatocurvus halotolerans]|uniref:Type IV pilus assembly protein PilB n=1 Tax=Chromatocurvus halotolerans TaxID=1132028 RepID=A0A4R2KR03_9GAMM|nr:type IV pilus assembly protein PilB [Chromatocurvus halotolerans]